MLSYKLLKDLPTFKAGTIFRVSAHGNLCVGSNVVYTKEDLEANPTILKDWFEEISKQPKTVYDLELEDRCWMVGTSVNGVYKMEWHDCYENERKCGDIYLTKKEAEKELAWRKARQILKQDTKGFKPDWTRAHEDRYNITLILYVGDRDEGNLGHLEVVNCIHGIDREFYFATKADAEESIKAHAKEWKIYLGVEE